MPLDEYRRANRENWNDRVSIHLKSSQYDVSAFIQDTTRLSPIVQFDRDLIGEVRDKALLHLMCHIGLDTLSWARLGAAVTGVDFSPRSIDAARRLALECGLAARFVEAELYDVPDVINEQFDNVYTSMGVLCWLPKVRGWAEVVAQCLKPGGTFLITEIHPIAWSLDQERDDELFSLVDSYFERETPLRFENDQTYTDGSESMEHQTIYDWNHALGEIVTALIQAGLQIELLQEYPFVYGWDPLPGLEHDTEGWVRPRGANAGVPLMYSIRARHSGTAN